VILTIVISSICNDREWTRWRPLGPRNRKSDWMKAEDDPSIVYWKDSVVANLVASRDHSIQRNHV